MWSEINETEVVISICAHENQGTIERSINSVLNQTFSDWKLIIIVSKSADATLSMCRQFSDPRIEIIEKFERQSWATSSIEAVDKANAKYFMWLDADDFIEKDWLSKNLYYLREYNSVGSFGRVMLSNDGGITLIDNTSNRRSYRFANSRFAHIRIISYLFLPESYGAVNILYSVWNSEFLKNSITWGKSEKSLDFDTEFILHVLSRSRISIVPDTFLIRENRGFNHHITSSFSSPAPKESYLSRISSILWQLFITKPRTSRYLNWVRRNPLYISVVLPVLILRIILSIFSPLLISVNLRIRSLFGTI